jgi:hypothetical protein
MAPCFSVYERRRESALALRVEIFFWLRPSRAANSVLKSLSSRGQNGKLHSGNDAYS